MARKKKYENPLVVQSNIFIRRKKKLVGVYALRLLATVARRVRTDDKDFLDYEIPVTEITGEKPDGRTLALLRESMGALGSYIYDRETEDGGWEMSGVFSYCRFSPSKSSLQVRFDPSMKTHYLNLKNNFTEYDYSEFMSLPSSYSQRLYEILKSYQWKGSETVSVADLNEWLDTPESYRKDFDLFRRKVLDQAYKDIVESGNVTSMWFTWEVAKRGGRGGKVEEIIFFFRPLAAERAADREEAVTRKTKLEQQAEAQRRSWACWHEHRQKNIECVPKERNQKCRYCLERGGKYSEAVRQGEEQINRAPMKGQIDFESLLKKED